MFSGFVNLLKKIMILGSDVNFVKFSYCVMASNVKTSFKKKITGPIKPGRYSVPLGL